MTDVYIEIDPRDFFERFGDDLIEEAENLLNEGVDQILVAAELVQVASYLKTSNPPQPAGSDYTRTFTLRRSSKTRRKGRRFPVLSGQWFTDPGIAPYADEVIGPRSEQKPIHRGRWKSLEEIQAKVDELAAAITEEKLNEISI